MRYITNERLLAYTLLMVFSSTCISSEISNSIISIGSVKTEAEKQAVSLAIKKSANLPSMEKMTNSRYSKFDPSIDIKTGGDDTFERAIAKFEGFGLFGDPDSTYVIVPVSFGVEADRNFENYSGILEVGLLPPFRSLSETIVLNREIKLGLFLQTGYKFEESATQTVTTTGNDNISQEDGGSVTRIKIKFGINTPKYGNDYVKAKFILDAYYWYDIKNEESYDREEYSVEFSSTKYEFLNGKTFDLKYEHGSGSPNFNEGDQFSANLNIEF